MVHRNCVWSRYRNHDCMAVWQFATLRRCLDLDRLSSARPILGPFLLHPVGRASWMVLHAT